MALAAFSKLDFFQAGKFIACSGEAIVESDPQIIAIGMLQSRLIDLLQYTTHWKLSDL